MIVLSSNHSIIWSLDFSIVQFFVYSVMTIQNRDHLTILLFNFLKLYALSPLLVTPFERFKNMIKGLIHYLPFSSFVLLIIFFLDHEKLFCHSDFRSFRHLSYWSFDVMDGSIGWFLDCLIVSFLTILLFNDLVKRPK